MRALAVRAALVTAFLLAARGSALKAAPGAQAEAWAGTWNRVGDNQFVASSLEISRVDARGFAFSLNAQSGAHPGEISGRATVEAGRAGWRDEQSGCEVSFVLKRTTITVEENAACGAFGGTDVTFGGVYRKGETRRRLSLSDLEVLDAAQEKELRHLAGDDYALFEDSFQLVSEGEDLDGLGASVRSGGVRGLFTIAEAIVMTAAGGKLWAAVIDSTDDTVKYFTNDPAWRRKLPKTIDAWRQPFADRRVIFPDG